MFHDMFRGGRKVSVSLLILGARLVASSVHTLAGFGSTPSNTVYSFSIRFWSVRSLAAWLSVDTEAEDGHNSRSH